MGMDFYRRVMGYNWPVKISLDQNMVNGNWYIYNFAAGPGEFYGLGLTHHAGAIATWPTILVRITVDGAVWTSEQLYVLGGGSGGVASNGPFGCNTDPTIARAAANFMVPIPYASSMSIALGHFAGGADIRCLGVIYYHYGV